MEEFLTITELIRKQLFDKYNILKQQYFDDIEYEDDDFDLEDYDITKDEIYSNEDDDEEDIFVDEVFLKLFYIIKNNKYKNLIFSVILHDVYEYLKSKEIAEIELYDFVYAIKEYIEIHNINQLIKKIETSQEFYLDLITLYLEYHLENSIDNRIKNKKLIELSNNQKYLEKFNIGFYDELQYQYLKNKF